MHCCMRRVIGKKFRYFPGPHSVHNIVLVDCARAQVILSEHLTLRRALEVVSHIVVAARRRLLEVWSHTSPNQMNRVGSVRSGSVPSNNTF